MGAHKLTSVWLQLAAPTNCNKVCPMKEIYIMINAAAVNVILDVLKLDVVYVNLV